MFVKNSLKKFSVILLTSLAFVFFKISFVFSQPVDSAKSPDMTTQKTLETIPYEGTDWVLKNLKGNNIKLSDFQGRPVILVFWATWCPFCKKLLPGIAQLNEEYESKGLKVIAVNIKEDWKPEVYWRNHGYTFESVLNGDEVAKIYGVKGTPGIVFIEPSGKVLGVHSFSDPHHPLLEKFAASYTKK